MSPDQWYIDGCTRVTPGEQKLFDEWTRHLPRREQATPYHSQAHSVKHFRHALAIAGMESNFSVFEIGFCLGYSSEIFFRLGASHVTSVEVSNRHQTIEASQIMGVKWSGRFSFIRPEHVRPRSKYDFAFIDGDHSKDSIEDDTRMVRDIGVEWVLYDDFWPHWGDTQQVMQELGITPVAILGTMALCDFR